LELGLERAEKSENNSEYSKQNGCELLKRLEYQALSPFNFYQGSVGIIKIIALIMMFLYFIFF
jgi:hypothetical protein